MRQTFKLSQRLPALALCCGLAAGAVLAAPPVSGDDWPQWRGRERDGKSAETGLLQSWPAGGPPLAYKASGIGSGFSAVAVAGGRIYTLGDIGDRQFVIGLEEKTGKFLWKTDIGKSWDDQYLGPRSTPTVDGDRLYVLSADGDLFCLEAAAGKLVWKKNLPADFGARVEPRMWKFAESPLVDGDRVIVTPDGPQAAMVALDKKTGKEIWRAAAPDFGAAGKDGSAYSSVVISSAAGIRQYVQLIGRGVIGVEAKSGKFLWGYNKVANNVANIPTVLVDGDQVFASTGYGAGGALLQIVKEGDALQAREVYFLPGNTFQNHHGGMILHQGHIYAGSGHNKGFPVAVELKTGKVAWGPERNQGTGSAAVAYADGRLYFRYQNGKMLLIEATPAGYKEHGSFDIPGVQHPSWPHPVIAGGRLYLREQDALYAYDVKAKS